MNLPYRILIAEDDEALGFLVAEILTEDGYEAVLANDGIIALDFLQSQHFDMLISDIQMPRLDGFGLLADARKIQPHLQTILMTAYNTDEYMDLIQQQGVGNVLCKGVPFDPDELRTLVHQLFSGDIFGLHRHMHPDTPIEVNEITSPSDIDDISNKLSSHYGADDDIARIRTVLVELLTNAVFYGARNEDGEDKSQWETNFQLNPEESITVYHGQDKDKVGFAVVDHGGRLTKDTILYWLNRQITPGKTGLPDGIFDSHGRGLYIVRKYVDQLLINVEPGKRCECITLNFFNPPPRKHKPIHIIELPATEKTSPVKE